MRACRTIVTRSGPPLPAWNAGLLPNPPRREPARVRAHRAANVREQAPFCEARQSQLSSVAMTERYELLIKFALCLLFFAVLAWRRVRRGEEADAGPMLIGMAAVALIAFINFFTFHYVGHEFTHSQEMFHYQLGSKYFPELGYDGLYEASIIAQIESHPDLGLPRAIRDLKTNEIVSVLGPVKHRAEVMGHFTPARWQSFVADHAYFAQAVADHPDYRIDHGYNPTPAWTFVGRLFNAWLPLTPTAVSLLALLDWALIGATLVGVHRTYGAAAAATFAILLGFGYPWRYVWVGGGFLRYD